VNVFFFFSSFLKKKKKKSVLMCHKVNYFGVLNSLLMKKQKTKVQKQKYKKTVFKFSVIY